MHFHALIRHSFIILILLASTGLSSVQGQTTQQKKEIRPYKKNYHIEKFFEYDIVKKDTVLNGVYLINLKPSLVDTLVEKKYHYKNFVFKYKNNKKEGSFEATGYVYTPDFTDFIPAGDHIQIPYKGYQFKNYGKYKEDKPAGHWTFIKSKKGYNTPSDTILIADANFSPAGKITGSYHYENNDLQMIVSGNFTNEGFLHGMWTVRKGEESYQPEVTYHYEEGSLVSVILSPEKEYKLNIQHEVSNFQKSSFNALYLEFLAIQLNDLLPSGKSNEAYDPFKEILASFDYLSLQYTGLSNEIPGGLNIENPNVQLPVYSLPEKDRLIIQNSAKRISALETKIDSVLSNPPFRNNRSAEKDIAALHARTQLLKAKNEKAKHLAETLNKPVARHIDVYSYLEKQLPEMKVPEEMIFNFNDEELKERIALKAAPENKNPVEQFNFYISQLEEAVEHSKIEAKEKYSRLIRNRTLLANEEILFRLADGIKSIADSLYLPLYRQEIENIYKGAFVDFTEQQIQQYSKLSLEERASAIDTLITCLEDVKQKLSQSWQLVERAQLVDQVYMEMKLNPYTYEKMNVRVHDKLFKAYERMIPFLVSAITPASSCEVFLKRVNNIKVLQNFMLEARKENTRKLERQFRLSDSPGTIIKKLEIPVELNKDNDA